MEAEGQRLLVQLEDIIRDFGELEKRWEGPDPEPELTLSRTYEIQHRRSELMYEWSMFQSQIRDQINAELEWRLEELGERQRLLTERSQGAQIEAAEAGLRVLRKVQDIMRDFVEFEERWPGPDSEDQILLLQGRMQEFLSELRDIPHPILVEISVELYLRITELTEQWRRYSDRLTMYGALLAEEVAAIIPITISGEHISDNNSITSSCPICYEDFELGEEADQLHCRHIFHQNCISPWLISNNSCPVCRRATTDTWEHLSFLT